MDTSMYRKMPCPGPSISLQRQTMMWHLYFFAPLQHALMPPLFPSHTSSNPLVFIYMAPLASIKKMFKMPLGSFAPLPCGVYITKRTQKKKRPPVYKSSFSAGIITSSWCSNRWYRKSIHPLWIKVHTPRGPTPRNHPARPSVR